MEKNYINLDWNLVEKIYSDKVKRLKRIAYKRVNDIEVAEDIVQNTMESICKRVNKDNKIYNLDAWVYTILKYRCIDIFRRKNIVQYFSNEILENYLIEEELNTIENMNLYNVLNNLEELDKKIVIYKFIYGFNNTEISKIFGCCNQTVTRKIEKSLEIMREKLLIG